MPGGSVRRPENEPAAPVEIPTPQEAVALVVRTRRKLSELPDVPKTMNAVGAVLSYTLFGLDTQEIAIALSITVHQVERIKALDAYDKMYQAVASTILEAEADDVRDVFRQHSKTAASVLVEALHMGTRGEKMMAAKDFLDRAGHRPADIVEHRHQMTGGLSIEIIHRDENDKPPTIDMEVEI